jgi:putative oxidoreductase
MLKIRDFALLGGRAVLGGYLAMHGSQKLFGAFDGKGLEETGKGFEAQGLAPGNQHALLAGVSELSGGVMTVLGVADPVAQLAIAGTMAVAAYSKRDSGPLAQTGGFELPLTNFALATVLAATGPGKLRFAPRLPKIVTVASIAVAAVVGSREIRHLVEAARPAERTDLGLADAERDPREPLRIGPVRTAGLA